jgi:hypothetical protein
VTGPTKRSNNLGLGDSSKWRDETKRVYRWGAPKL